MQSRPFPTPDRRSWHRSCATEAHSVHPTYRRSICAPPRRWAEHIHAVWDWLGLSRPFPPDVAAADEARNVNPFHHRGLTALTVDAPTAAALDALDAFYRPFNRHLEQLLRSHGVNFSAWSDWRSSSAYEVRLTSAAQAEFVPR